MDELEEQLKMLEGLDFDNAQSTVVVQPDNPTGLAFNPNPTVMAVETADTLLGNVPFGSVQQPIGTPFTPENPTNTGIVTSSIATPGSVQGQAAAQTVQSTVTAPVNNSVVQQTTPIQPAAQPSLDMNAAPVFVNLGESIHQTKTDFLKLKENECTRVAIKNYGASGTHFHYENGLGYFKCLSNYVGDDGVPSEWPVIKGICCMQPNPNDKSKLVGRGKKKVFLPVVEYPVSHVDGKTIVQGATPKLKVLALSNQEYQTLFDVRNEYGDDTSVFDLSIVRKKSDRGGFLEYKLTPGPSWRAKFGSLIQDELNKIDNTTYNLASEEFAKTLSAERIAKFYKDKAQQDAMVQQLANQQVVNPTDLGLSL